MGKLYDRKIMIHKNRLGSESHLSSWRTAAAWEAFC